jgi:hypothetical protein
MMRPLFVLLACACLAQEPRSTDPLSRRDASTPVVRRNLKAYGERGGGLVALQLGGG